MHIGSLPWYIRGFRQRIEIEDLKEGDVIIHNHPYLGASHTPDIAVAMPIIWEGEVLGFAAVTAHVLDVGGSYPGHQRRRLRHVRRVQDLQRAQVVRRAASSTRTSTAWSSTTCARRP